MNRSLKLAYVPKPAPNIPKTNIPISFQKIQLNFPKSFGQNVTISIIGGNKSASAVELPAPTSGMILSRFGMLMANETRRKKMKKYYSDYKHQLSYNRRTCK